MRRVVIDGPVQRNGAVFARQDGRDHGAVGGALEVE